MTAILAAGRYVAPRLAWDEDALTCAIEAGRRALDGAEPPDGAGLAVGGEARSAERRFLDRPMLEPGLPGPVAGARPSRLALASTSLGGARRVVSGLVAQALGLPTQTFCLDCTQSDRAGTEAMLALGNGLVIASDGPYAAALLLGEGSGLARLVAAQSASGEFPGVDHLDVPDYAQDAYLEMVRGAVGDLTADVLAINPPQARLARRVTAMLGCPEALTAPAGAGAAGPLLALLDALGQAQPGQRVLLVSYGAGSAADALLFEV